MNSDINLKEISIKLIKGHLMNLRLINGLNEAGFYSQDYHFYFGDVIFQLIGIDEEKEELFEVYLNWCSRVSRSDILRSENAMDLYAEEMYNVLLMERN
jgi:hypothetical protein